MKKYYSKENIKHYTQNQIERHDLEYKLDKWNTIEYYEKPYEHILGHMLNTKKSLNMICLGTRNEREKDVFDRLFNRNNKIVNVKSLDIAPNSEADYIMDFNKFPNNWENKWDIIFSNSIDHCVDAGVGYKEWIRILKPNGLLYVMFDLWDGAPSSSDCCIFEDGDIQKILDDNKSDITIILKEEESLYNKSYYKHLLVKKNEK